MFYKSNMGDMDYEIIKRTDHFIWFTCKTINRVVKCKIYKFPSGAEVFHPFGNDIGRPTVTLIPPRDFSTRLNKRQKDFLSILMSGEIQKLYVKKGRHCSYIYKKRFSQAIDELKAKGVLYKDEDNILKIPARVWAYYDESAA